MQILKSFANIIILIIATSATRNILRNSIHQFYAIFVDEIVFKFCQQGWVSSVCIGWFLCQSSNWYIPQQHVCDSIEHCPSEEDEHTDICHSGWFRSVFPYC